MYSPICEGCRFSLLTCNIFLRNLLHLYNLTSLLHVERAYLEVRGKSWISSTYFALYLLIKMWFTKQLMLMSCLIASCSKSSKISLFSLKENLLSLFNFPVIFVPPYEYNYMLYDFRRQVSYIIFFCFFITSFWLIFSLMVI